MVNNAHEAIRNASHAIVMSNILKVYYMYRGASFRRKAMYRYGPGVSQTLNPRLFIRSLCSLPVLTDAIRE